jgi:hypothetical protein
MGMNKYSRIIVAAAVALNLYGAILAQAAAPQKLAEFHAQLLNPNLHLTPLNMAVLSDAAQGFLAAAPGPITLTRSGAKIQLQAAGVDGAAPTTLNVTLLPRRGATSLPASLRPLVSALKSASSGNEKIDILNTFFDRETSAATPSDVAAAIAAPSKSGLAPSHETAAFAISEQHRILQAWQKSPRKTVVAVNSFSFDYNSGIVGAEVYDMRNVQQILEAADPNINVIYVTALPFDASMIDHILANRPDKAQILSRVHFVALNDAGPDHLAAKLLQPRHQRERELIRSKIREASKAGDSPAAIVPYMSGPTEWELAKALGIANAVVGPHPSLRHWTDKSGNRESFRAAGIPMADGRENIYDLESLVDASEEVLSRKPSLKRLVFKLNAGTSGNGNLYADVSGWMRMTREQRVASARAQMEAFKVGSVNDLKNFLQLTQSMGCVVEEFLNLTNATFPSGQAEIMPDGTVRVLSTHEQILKDKNVFQGLWFLAKPAYRNRLEEMTAAVGKELARHGVIGRIAVDYAAVPRPDGGYDLFGIEVNVRLGGSTHPYGAAVGLTDSVYKDGVLRRKSDGAQVFYKSLDHDVRLNLIGLDVDPFLAFFARPENRGLVFDAKAGKGVLFHLLSAVRIKGNVGYTIIGLSKNEVTKLQQRLTKALDQLEVEYQTGSPRGFIRQRIGVDVRDHLKGLKTEQWEKLFEQFMARHPEALFNRDTGKGVIFHPHGYSLLGRTAADIEEVRARTDSLLARYAYEAEIAVRRQSLKANQTIFMATEGKEQEYVPMLDQSLTLLGQKLQIAVDDSPVDPSRLTAAFLTLPSIWKHSIAEEGGRQRPGDFILALDPSWFIQETGPDGKTTLYVTKGLSYDKTGKNPVLTTYTHPRPVDYFANWLTLADFQRDDGVPLQYNLNIPQSSSLAQEKFTGDKLRTRQLMAAAGKGDNVPASHAFLLPRHSLLSESVPATTRVTTSALNGRLSIEKGVQDFLNRYDGAEVVVKPTGVRFHSGEGVKIFDRSQFNEIVEHIDALSRHPKIDSHDAILIDERIQPPPIYLSFEDYTKGSPFAWWHRKRVNLRVMEPSEISAAQLHEKKDYNYRVFVQRSAKGAPVTSRAFVRAGTWGKPTNVQTIDPADSAAVIRIEEVIAALRRQYGLLKTDAEVEILMREMDEISKTAMRAILKAEARMTRELGDPYQAQTDVLSLDFMFQVKGGKVVPSVIEVNTHDSGGQTMVDQFYPERAGEHSRAWIRNIWIRAAENRQRRSAIGRH